MRKVIALLTHAVGSGDRAARDGWEYFGSFGDDIFSDADDPFEPTVDQRRPTAARVRLADRTTNTQPIAVCSGTPSTS